MSSRSYALYMRINKNLYARFSQYVIIKMCFNRGNLTS